MDFEKMRIFISYSRADKEFIKEFSRVLAKALPKDQIWYDEQIQPGDTKTGYIISEWRDISSWQPI